MFEGSIDRRRRATSRKSAIANLDPSRRGELKEVIAMKKRRGRMTMVCCNEGTQNAQGLKLSSLKMDVGMSHTYLSTIEDVIRNRDPVPLAIVTPLAVIIHLARPKNDFRARSVAAKEKEKRLIR
ncbi:uncharacterized protein G2W53_037194 [Senna tora]|uniref:Uncharacterized protein n=1 Tax=Senna tora TaxID=362788 RepID=A0A834SWU9_9FABA|nr:uncharacterized protein G2W53_037194 [Senna tora]